MVMWLPFATFPAVVQQAESMEKVAKKVTSHSGKQLVTVSLTEILFLIIIVNQELPLSIKAGQAKEKRINKRSNQTILAKLQNDTVAKRWEKSINR